MIPAKNAEPAKPLAPDATTPATPRIVPHPVRKVVFAPDLLIAALYDPRARNLLNQWRDGTIIPVVTRDLLLLYLRTLRNVGLTADLVRKWSLWLSAPAKTVYLEYESPTGATGLKLCREVAAASGTEMSGQYNKA